MENVSRLEALQSISQKEAEPKPQLAVLENARSISEPIISQLIESFQREIAELEAYIQKLESAVAMKRSKRYRRK